MNEHSATAERKAAPELPFDRHLSIVIVNWNTRDLLVQCLESVRRSRVVGGVEVVVVDNASEDGSAQVIRERFPWVRLVANTENAGFARANNQAIPLTTGRYVLLLNPDTQVRPGALEALVQFMDEHPVAGAAGARLTHPDGTLQVSCSLSPTLARELWRLFYLDAVWPYASYGMAQWDLQTPRSVDVVQGACMILRREALAQVGLLDEDYFIYSEEVDLCNRLRHKGWDIWWVPQAAIVHYGGQSTRQVASAMFLRLYHAKVLYFHKNHGRRTAQAYKFVLVAASLPRLLPSLVAWAQPAKHRQRSLALTRHYYRLLTSLRSF